MFGSLASRFARRWRRAGSHHALGTRGEIAAERYMRERGWRVLARNAKTPRGEVDLVLEERQSGAIVIVEVKTRVMEDGSAFRAERSIDRAKRRRLLGIADHLRRANGWLDRPIRIDIIVVEFVGSEIRIRHLADAVRRR